jgi:Ca-activated chloride channel family protein
MKRFLDQQHHTLSEHEKNEIWRGINLATARRSAWTRGALRPALGVTVAALALAIGLSWWQGGRVPVPGEIMGLGQRADQPRVDPPVPPEIRVKAPGSGSAGEVPPPPKPVEAAPTPRQEADRFDVEGAEYMVEVKSEETEHEVNSDTFEKYAIDSVDDAVAKQAGTVTRAGELYERGGRSKEVAGPPGSNEADRALAMARRVAPATPPPGSVTGGTTPPNGEAYELMYFQHTGVNPFVATEEDALSTFAIDVDNASWTLARSYLERGELPPADAIRVEEFVNSFEAGWPVQTAQPLVIHADGAPSRFGAGYHLLRVGLAGQQIDISRRKPANLVFVVDVSGSMDRENRLGAVRYGLSILLDELQEGDQVGIVVYGSRGEIRLEPTDISRREVIQAAIDGLLPAGSTNAYEGLQLAYTMARQHYEAGRLNRLILCSDGVANTGRSTEAGGILDQVRGAADEGITLSTVGFGMGNYNDVLMEKLADTGDGNYAYVDRRDEAERVFRENLTGMLQTVARETKIQVEFDPDHVARWRLLGYENRDVADRDFRNDAVDAGEVGANHRVTALYELKLTDDPAAATIFDEETPSDAILATIRLRWEAPAHDTARAGQVTEIARTVSRSDLTGDFARASLRLRVQAVVAEFAEILRGSYWARGSELADLVPVADGLAAAAPEDAQVAELARLVRRAAELAAAQSTGTGSFED